MRHGGSFLPARRKALKMEKTITATGLESRKTRQKGGARIAILVAHESPERRRKNRDFRRRMTRQKGGARIAIFAGA